MSQPSPSDRPAVHDETAPAWRRAGRWLVDPGQRIWLLLALFVALRLLQVLGATHSFDDEDGFNLTAAWEWVHNDVWPYQVYQLSDWEHGTRLVVTLAAPLLLLFGPVVAVLKLVALSISSLTLCALYLTARENFGTRVATFATLLYIFAPLPVFHYSMTAHGFHSDSMALQLLFVWQLTLLLRGRDEPWRYLVTGLLGGFAVWFAYIAVMVVIPGSLALAWRTLCGPKTRAVLARFGLFAAGGALFAGAILVYNIFNDFTGFKIHYAYDISSYVSLSQSSDKLAHFVGNTLPKFVHFSNDMDQGNSVATAYNLFFLLLGLVAMIAPWVAWLCGRKKTASAARPALIDALVPAVVMLTLFVFFASKHPVEPWHLVPLLILLFIPITARIHRLYSGARAGKVVALLLTVILFAPGTVANLRQIHPERFGLAFAVENRHYPLFFNRIREFNARIDAAFAVPNSLRWIRLPLEFEHSSEWYTTIPVSYFGDDILRLVLRQNPADDIVAFARHQQLEHKHQRKLLVLAGFVMVRGLLYERITEEQLIALTPRFSDPEMDAVMEGFGFGVEPPYLGRMTALVRRFNPQNRQRAELLRQRWLERMALGMGRSVRVPQLFESDDFHCGALLPLPLRQHFMEGLGHGTACRIVGPIPSTITNRICSKYLKFFANGARRTGLRCRAAFRLNRQHGQTYVEDPEPPDADTPPSEHPTPEP